MSLIATASGAEPVQRVCVEDEMTIYTAARHKALLLEAMQGSDTRALEIDLSHVTEIDSAGVQVMLATRRFAAARGRAITFTAAESGVRSTLALLGLDSLVNGAAAAGDPASPTTGSREEGA